MLHLVAKSYGKRPSEVAGITDEWAAYQLDAAALLASVDDDDDGPDATAADWLALARR